MKNKDTIQDRKTLKSYFLKGSRPTEEHFEKLINSTFNKADDGLDIDESGLQLYATYADGNLISLYQNKDQIEPKWILIASEKDNGLLIKEGNDERKSDDKQLQEVQKPSLFLKKAGGLGIRTNDPKHALDVNGIVASHGRLGNYLEDKVNSVPADGQWHNVFPEALEHCNAYEIMAYAGADKGDGKYSLLHAIVVSTYGNSRPKIRMTRAHFGKWWNKIALRWESRPSVLTHPEKEKWWRKLLPIWLQSKDLKYNLQIKTKSNYGDRHKIHFNISMLWGEEIITNSNWKKREAWTSDDLTKIEGIGPKVAEVLIQQGIDSYSKLASKLPHEIKEILKDSELHMGFLRPGSWPKQANMAANNRWKELEEWQERVKGGVENGNGST